MKEKKQGFVKTVILIIIALIALKYAFHFDVIEYLKSPGPQKIITDVWNWIKSAYNWLDSFIGHFFKK